MTVPRIARTLSILLTAVALGGCQGMHELSDAGCLPLHVPATVTLLRPARLERRDDGLVFLSRIERQTAPGATSRMQPIGVVAPGSALRIERLAQEWGFDSGDGTIYAFGTTPDGAAFRFAWGYHDQVWPAPWDAPGSDAPRKVDCAR